MGKKPFFRIAAIVVATSSVIGLVAYRLGRRAPGGWFTSSSSPGAGSGCVDFHEAGSHVGETACVSGRVLRVFASRGGNTFLDFCSDYRECPFTSVIFASDRTKFGDLNTLSGQQVEIRGMVAVYQGRAEIIIHDSKQIRVVP